MKRRCALSRAVRLAAESMPAPGDDDELINTVSGLEGLHDGDDRGGLGLVPFPAPDSQGETTAVDQQADDGPGGQPAGPWSNPPAAGRPHARPRNRAWSRLQAQRQTGGAGDVLEQGV